jgi:antitoxin VapB
MRTTAKLFTIGRRQAVRLPSAFRFSSEKVHIRKDPETGDIILSAIPNSWDEIFALADATKISNDFLAHRDRRRLTKPRL